MRPNPVRNDVPRYGNGRGDAPVNEPVRPDAAGLEASRQEQPRQDQPRQEQPRQDYQRPARTNDAPPRSRRRRDEPDARGAEDVAALPAFLMTPPRPIASVEPLPAPEPVAARAAPSDDEAAPLAPKPRRRRRARFEGSNGAEGNDGAASDVPSVTE